MTVSTIADPLKNELLSKGVSSLGEHCGIQFLAEKDKSVSTVLTFMSKMQLEYDVNIVLVPESIARQVTERIVAETVEADADKGQ